MYCVYQLPIPHLAGFFTAVLKFLSNKEYKIITVYIRLIKKLISDYRNPKIQNKKSLYMLTMALTSDLQHT